MELFVVFALAAIVLFMVVARIASTEPIPDDDQVPQGDRDWHQTAHELRALGWLPDDDTVEFVLDARKDGPAA